ncbi:PilW family protein [Accumulibacter sp.]|uniref:PilW family protein n=1 Tax=Accumulibacter sp. TaxID=2053492 RepID=UPI0025DAAFC9|nr:PilW family protein [Accumulibacter sp.]MCM8594785.1 PilW family protein [Accumulibacter sp.]MCM8625110.1 PilW family protein [Accumulibacter sp.]MDS4048930.1 PilW family protein [Accumulibacter sp.]
MKRLPAPVVKRRGFTLVEVLVAMVIGMIGVIIMMQVFTTSEAQRRATTGTGDAQSNGAMALYILQRDIRQAGFGFNALNALACPLTLPAPSGHTLSQLAPVIINPPDVPAGDANTDRLLIAYGSGDGSPEGAVITLAMGAALGVDTAASFNVNERVMVAPSAPTIGCALTTLTVTAVAPPIVTTSAAGGANDGDTLFNLGFAPRVFAYAVRGGDLTVCDYLQNDCSIAANTGNPAIWVPIASDIVSLRAQYGRDTTAPGMDGNIDVWDQTTPQQLVPPDQEAFACRWARTLAVRIAVVARNTQFSRDILTAAAPTWEGSATAPINLSGLANWQNYRYRVSETVIPLRNLPWMPACS